MPQINDEKCHEANECKEFLVCHIFGKYDMKVYLFKIYEDGGGIQIGMDGGIWWYPSGFTDLGV